VLNIARTWLEAGFDGGRHERRVRKIAAIERGEDPARVDCGPVSE
jgi:ribose 5-phosphate isomerase RpiB